jgi:sulfotransferase family protein
VPRVIFLAGLGRSGTTLLERALGELPGVQPLGEVVHLWRRGVEADEKCGCGEAFSDCPFWRAVGEEAFGGWGRVDVKAVEFASRCADRTWRLPQLLLRLRRDPVIAAARLLADRHRRIYVSAANVSGADVVVDSSKHPSLAWCLRLDPTIDLRVVHVIRDSRGVAYSWTRTVERPEAVGRSDGRWMTRYSPTRAAVLWSAQNAATALLRNVGVPVLLVRYESFVAEPKIVLSDIARFSGIAPDGEALDFVLDDAIRLRRGHTVAGNPVRFATGRVALRADDAWRCAMPRADRWIVGALTAPQLARYGYARRLPS